VQSATLLPAAFKSLQCSYTSSTRAPHKPSYSLAAPTPTKLPEESLGHAEFTPVTSALSIAGTRLDAVRPCKAALSKGNSPPMSPLPSEISMSAQFQNSSGADVFPVHEFVVM